MAEQKSFSVIQFPGVLRDPQDPTKAIAALGGEKAVRTSVRTSPLETATPLTLNLRPGVGNSSSNIVAEKTAHCSNLFVLEVTEDTPDTTSRENAVESSPAKKTQQDEQASVIKGTILGNATAFTEFRSLADFQYHARRPKRPRSEGQADSQPDGIDDSVISPREMQAMSELDMAGETMFRLATGRKTGSDNQDTSHLIDRLRPARFVRNSLDYGTTDYWFRQFGVNTDAVETTPHLAQIRGRELGEDRRSDANRLMALSHRISADAETVPQHPTAENLKPPVVRGVEAFNELCEILEKRFQERPVWIRRALHDGIPKRLRNSFKRAITTVAYSFQGPGPFFQAWIRYGYDPRKNPSSRQYQVVEIRCNHPVVRVAIKERKTNPPEDIPDDEEFRIPEAYTLSHIPLHKNNFVQVCDISIQAAVDFCNEEESLPNFDKKYGFFSEAGYQKLVAIIKGVLVENSTRFLGKDRVEKILVPYTLSTIPKKKRTRLKLGDVMKPKLHAQVKKGRRKPPPIPRRSKGNMIEGDERRDADGREQTSGAASVGAARSTAEAHPETPRAEISRDSEEEGVVEQTSSPEQLNQIKSNHKSNEQFFSQVSQGGVETVGPEDGDVVQKDDVGLDDDGTLAEHADTPDEEVLPADDDAGLEDVEGYEILGDDSDESEEDDGLDEDEGAGDDYGEEYGAE